MKRICRKRGICRSSNSPSPACKVAKTESRTSFSSPIMGELDEMGLSLLSEGGTCKDNGIAAPAVAAVTGGNDEQVFQRPTAAINCELHDEGNSNQSPLVAGQCMTRGRTPIVRKTPLANNSTLLNLHGQLNNSNCNNNLNQNLVANKGIRVSLLYNTELNALIPIQGLIL